VNHIALNIWVSLYWIILGFGVIIGGVLLLSLFSGVYDKIKRNLTIYRHKNEQRKQRAFLRKAISVERKERAQLKKRLRVMGFDQYRFRDGERRWGTKLAIKKWKNEEIRTRKLEVDFDNNFTTLDPYEFEDLIRDLFENMGYNASTTTRSGDYGADIIVEKDGMRTVVEVKKYASNNRIGAEEIQRLLGSMWLYKAESAIFVTTSSFTRQAVRQSTNAPVELWDREILLSKMKDTLFSFEDVEEDNSNHEDDPSKYDGYYLKYLPIVEYLLDSDTILVEVGVPSLTFQKLEEELKKTVEFLEFESIIEISVQNEIVYLERIAGLTKRE
jgi:hypothetical protein